MPTRITGTVFITDNLADTMEAESILPPPVTGVKPDGIMLADLDHKWRLPGPEPVETLCCVCDGRFDHAEEGGECIILARKQGDNMAGMVIHKKCLAGRLIAGG